MTHEEIPDMSPPQRIGPRLTDAEVRVCWRERRRGGIFDVIADRVEGEWKYFEQTPGEVRWYPVSETHYRRAHVEQAMSALDGGAGGTS
jgi:hypothetical protein